MAFRRSERCLLRCFLNQTINLKGKPSTSEGAAATLSSSFRRSPHLTSAVCPEDSILVKFLKSLSSQTLSGHKCSSKNSFHVFFRLAYEHESCGLNPDGLLEAAGAKSASLFPLGDPAKALVPNQTLRHFFYLSYHPSEASPSTSRASFPAIDLKSSFSSSVEHSPCLLFPAAVQNDYSSSLLSSSVYEKGLCENLPVTVPPSHSSVSYFSMIKTARAQRSRETLDEIQHSNSKQVTDKPADNLQKPSSDQQDEEKTSSYGEKQNTAFHGEEVTESVNGWTRHEIINWPNGISMARLLSGPALAWMVLHELPHLALGGMLLAGISDWLDGHVARRMGINSVLGSYLDPLADKVLVGSVALSMAYAGLLHPALVALLLARDGALLVGAFFYRAHSLGWKWTGWGEYFRISSGGAAKIEPLFISKVNTVLQVALICVALLRPSIGNIEPDVLISFLSWSVVSTTIASWFGYGWVYLIKPGKLEGILSKKDAPHFDQ